jgi:signal transduction histidine kinase
LDLNLAQIILDYAEIDTILLNSHLEILEWSEGAYIYAFQPLNKSILISECIPEIDTPQIKAQIEEVLLGREGRFLLQGLQRTLSHGEPLFFSLAIQSYTLPETKSPGLVCLLRDVTEAALLLQKVEELKQVKSGFLAIASHELRAPLTNVNGFLDLVLDGSFGTLQDEQRHYLTLASKNLSRMLTLTNDLLDVERLENGSIQIIEDNFDLLRLTRVLGASFESHLQKHNLELVVEAVAGEAFPVLADMSRIEQVISNLINNAIKYSQPTSTKIVIQFEKQGDKVIVNVIDEGIGIPEQDQPRLFHRFFRATNASSGGARGNGLGLSIVKAIIEQHNGSVWLTSIAGVGSTFSFSLPLAR